jgi:hypothetical protein
MADYGSIGVHASPDLGITYAGHRSCVSVTSLFEIGVGYKLYEGLKLIPIAGRNDVTYFGVGYELYEGLKLIPIAGVIVSSIGIRANASLLGYINGNDDSERIAIQPILTPPPVTFNTFSPNIGVQAIGIWGYTERPLDTLGSIVGTVKVEGGLRTDMLVRLYYKTTGILIASTKTDANGSFRFDFLEVGKPLYTALSFNLDESFNAVVMDGISPVPTLSL